MQLQIRSESGDRTFSDIGLYQGYKPVIGNLSPHSQATDEPIQISPVIWFKTFAVDSVLVDCIGKDLRWKPIISSYNQQPTDLASLSRKQDYAVLYPNSLRESGECFDFDINLEDMFDSVSYFMSKIKSKEYKDEKKVASEVLRLLHCYILPAIILHKEDMPGLQEGLVLIDRLLQSIEYQVNKVTNSMVLLESTLSKQRERLLKTEGFQREQYVRICSPDFLSVFLKHIVWDINNFDRKLELAQLEVEKEKRQDDSNGDSLMEKRKIRDDLHGQKQSLSLVRENIKSVLYRPQTKHTKTKSKTFVNSFHRMYVDISEKLKFTQKEIDSVCRNKLRILCVREAIKNTLDELKVTDESTGVQMLSDGTSEGDLIDGDIKPVEWNTLTDKVLILLKENRKVMKLHYEFTESISKVIKLSLEEVQLFSVQRQKSNANDNSSVSSFDDLVVTEDEDQVVVLRKHSDESQSGNDRKTVIDKSEKELLDLMAYSTVNGRKSRSNFSKQVDDSDPDRTSYQPLKFALENLRHKINHHMRQMIRTLYIALSEDGKDMSNKLWIAYGDCLHREILHQLADFYEGCYESVCGSLGNALSKLTPMDLGLTEPWIECYFCYKNDIDFSNLYAVADNKFPLDGTYDEQSKVRAVSTDGHLSYDDFDFDSANVDLLYTRANDEAAQVSSDLLRRPWSYSDTSSVASSISVPSDLTDLDEKCANINTEQHFQIWDETLKELKLYTLDTIKAVTVLSKLKCLTKMVKYIATALPRLQGVESVDTCCDDILTLLIIHVLSLDDEHRWKLYAHLKLVLDNLPPFMRGSQHDYSLVNFYQAFWYLFDRHVLSQRASAATLLQV